MTTLSFNNDPVMKAEHVAQAEKHAAMDMLVSGTYAKGTGKKFKACSVGCFAHDIAPERDGYWHQTISEARHLPEWLIRLQDGIFEGLPADERASFHVELAKRIPVGKNLEPVQHYLAIARIDRMLVTQRKALDARHEYGVTEAIAQTIAALEVGRRAHEGAAGGDNCQLSAARSAASAEWSAARSAAWSAESAAWSAARSAESARSAAWSAAWSAESAGSAESAEWSAARSAEWSAESAAWSAARSAESARSAAWKDERDDLFASLDKAARS